MINLLRQLLAEKEVRTSLEFGINDNLRLIRIDNEEKKRDGEVIRRNTNMTFAKMNNKGAVIANTTFNYFDLDPESDYTSQNFATQVAQLNNIASVLNPGSTVDPTEGYSDMEELVADLGSKKGCKKLIKATWDQFEAAVSDHVGPESMLIRMKVVTEKKGKYLQLPKDSVVIESMEGADEDSMLRIQPFELKMKNNASLPNANKAAADAPGEKLTSKKNIVNI